MGAWEGLLGGFMDRKYTVEKQNMEQALDAGRREQAIFSTLINSDDPEIAQMAMAGLLDSANPKKKKGGLRGWIGEMESSPYLPRIQALLQTPVTEHGSIQLPGEAEGINGPIQGMPNVTPTITTPPGNQPAGMAPTSMVDAKTQPSAPPVPMTYTQPPPIPTTTQRPRRAFMSPYDKAMQTEEAQQRGAVRGRVGGYVEAGGTREEALAIERAKLRGVNGLHEGNVHQDANGNWVQDIWGAGGQVVAQIPARDPKSASLRAPNPTELMAATLFPSAVGETPQATLLRVAGGPDGPANLQRIQDAVRAAGVQTVSAEATARTMATALAEAAAPLSRMDALQATQSLRGDWMKVTTPHTLVRNQMGVLDSAEEALKRGDRATSSERIIVTFEKMLDALSVVRESEYLRPMYNQSLYDRVKGTLDRMRSGGAPLSNEALYEYLRAAREMGAAALKDHAQHRAALERTARTAGIDIANIFGDLPASPASPPPASPGAPTAPPRPVGLGPSLDDPIPGATMDANGNVVFR